MLLPLNQTITVRALRLVATSEGVQLVALEAGCAKVNGKIEDAHLLRDGDRIDIGSQGYLVRKQDADWVLLDLDKDLLSQQLVRSNNPMSSHDAVMAMLDALTELTNIRDVSRLLPLVLKACAQVLDADEALLDPTGDVSERIYYPQNTLAISATAVQRALERNEAVLWNQSEGDSLDLSKSIVSNQLTSILVAPFSLSTHTKTKGFLYLQRKARSQPFGSRDCEVFSRFVSLCAMLVSEAKSLGEMRSEIAALRKVQDRGGLIYACEAMEKLVALASRVAAAPVPVVIHGETGTGKEVLAKFIHQNGPRAEKPFVAVNCGAIPANLIESILFGHVKGSFTGAIDSRKGLFEDADGGTLFLDEIGDLPLDMQVKLLRVLQEKKVTRVGDSKEISIDVRILSASHRDLQTLVHEGLFREDLFFRLSVMQLVLPPLRDRGQDVIVLARRFLERYTAEFGMPEVSFGKAAEKVLLGHDWPGNVRELENRVQKSLVQCDGDTIKPQDLGLDSEASGERGLRSLQAARESAERICVDRALKDARGNLTLAGQILGIDRKVLRDVMERLGIEKSHYKGGSDED